MVVRGAVAALGVALLGCSESPEQPAPTEAQTPPAVRTLGGEEARLSPEELERGRLDPAWRQVVRIDSTRWADGTTNPEDWEEISPQTVNAGPAYLPLGSDGAGPSVLRVQTLLDRALFSPGIIDGRWGKNTEKAIYWLQRRENLPATGWVDSVTFARLAVLAGGPAEVVREHQLTAEDVEGPFIELPEDVYERAELECTCYESLTEKLSELFHTAPELLQQLNPGAELDALKAGDRIWVPNVRDPSAEENASVARLVVSDGGHYVHAMDGDGRILFHFPSTLGASYDPSPDGDHRVVSITEDPWWHYQPDILEAVDDSRPEAKIPPGPNNAVGLVWMALSKPHYGIHGTKAPETIGYAVSAGCVRLTNWDALFLARRIEPDTPVQFIEG